jgi:predicted 2-oxoglutarate/Fe(II)-dependent dioxygenase YbiX
MNCTDIINFIEDKTHLRIENDKNHYTKISLNRNTESWLFDFVESKLESHYTIKEYFRGLKYTEGDFMSLHKDGDYSQAYLSGGILLNDDYDGGEFIIEGTPLDIPIGEVFTFGRDKLHEVKPIKSGVRYSLHFHIMLREPNLF